MFAGGDRKWLDVVGIGGDDVIRVLREQDERGVDHVPLAAELEELTRGTAEAIVERADLYAGERPGEQCLPRALAAPNVVAARVRRLFDAACISGVREPETVADRTGVRIR